MIRYPARYEKERKWYVAEFVDIPGAETAGKTLRELKSNAQEDLSSVLQDFLDDGEMVPAPSRAEGARIIQVEPSPGITYRIEHPEDNVPRPLNSRLEKLLGQIHSEELKTRRMAVHHLRRSWRRRAREAMVEMLGDKDPITRNFAMLGLLHQAGKEAAPAIKELLADPHLDVRLIAVHVLGRLEPSAGPRILPLLRDPQSAFDATQ
jgi:predicted RNase H-like HicB family nuclease